MARYETIDGLLLLNKPAGLTSNQALQRVKRLLNAKKAGHTGSLDPAATGMLPLCFGEATKVCAFLLDADKTYRVTARLGIATDTGDADGAEIATAAVPELAIDKWREILESFLGESQQVPPMYSALKKDGKRLYTLARQGQTVEREPRPIRIDEISLLEIAGTRLVFWVHCAKGTYVRTLVEDIAKKAGTVAHTARLHRESVGDFQADDMLDLTGLEEVAAAGAEGLKARLLPPDTALEGLAAVELDNDASDRFTVGQVNSVSAPATAGLVRVYGGANEFLGVGELSDDGQLAPKRVFRTGEKNP
jgi:tRNA pseudouridine55 synthase